jgi:decaprenylphospho-beta-D-erythro-pentofuranosid-2-ulose 2-reductase
MKILIIGATSAIAKATARIYAEQGNSFYLIGRNAENLTAVASDLVVRGASDVHQRVLDLNNFTEHEDLIEDAFKVLGLVDIALICHGSLPEQEKVETNFKQALKEINTNGISVISLLTALAAKFIQQQQGTIAVITSVAGDRGRQPNFVYGAAKSLVSTYIQGLRGKLLRHRVHLIDIRPGLVDSPMTAEFPKGALWSSPEQIASKIVSSIRKGSHTVYAPGYWRLIMFIVGAIPEFIFKRLKF